MSIRTLRPVCTCALNALPVTNPARSAVRRGTGAGTAPTRAAVVAAAATALGAEAMGVESANMTVAAAVVAMAAATAAAVAATDHAWREGLAVCCLDSTVCREQV